MKIGIEFSQGSPTTPRNQSQQGHVHAEERTAGPSATPTQIPTDPPLKSADAPIEEAHEHEECGEHCLGPNYIERMKKGLEGPRYGIPNGLSAEEIGDWITKVADGDPETVKKALEIAKQHEQSKDSEPNGQRASVVDSKRQPVFSTKKRRR